MSIPSSSALVTDHAEHFARAQAGLDVRAAQSAGSRSDSRGSARAGRGPRGRLAQTRQQQLHGDTGLGEHDRLATGPQKGQGRLMDSASGPGRMPWRTSITGGFRIDHMLPPAGAPLRSTTVILSAGEHLGELPGFPIVAEQQMICGFEP